MCCLIDVTIRNEKARSPYQNQSCALRRNDSGPVGLVYLSRFVARNRECSIIIEKYLTK